MFGGRNSNDGKKAAAPTKDHGVTILTSGCHFSGKLYCRGTSRIGGKVEGEIISEGSLIIEEGAQITASILAEEAVIQGQVRGKIKANKRVELCSNSRFDGDVQAPSLIIREGAQFNGTSEMSSAIESLESKMVKRGPNIVKDTKMKPEGKQAPAIDTPSVAKELLKDPEISVAQ